jgi:hypothetical protein
MKTLTLSLIAIILVSVLYTYIFIPNNLSVSTVTYIKSPPDAAARYLHEPKNWQKWWIDNDNGIHIDHAYIFKSDTFTITKITNNSVHLLLANSNLKISSVLHMFPIPPDSVAISWETVRFKISSNPIERLRQYFNLLEVKNEMTTLLMNLKSFLSNTQKVYGFNIKKTSTTDTLLVATKDLLPAYPATQDIYQKVLELQTYVSKEGAKQTGPPMVNISKSDSTVFQLMVAIPTDKKLAGEGNIFYRRMVPGNFLVTEVRGGTNEVNEAIKSLELFINDYKKMSMAIPFQVLLTDRSKEPDSSKWLTQVYYPIAY